MDNNSPIIGQPRVVAQIVITLTDNGQLNVSGNIQDKIAAYGLLEAAKETLAINSRKQAEQQVQLSAPVPGLHV